MKKSNTKISKDELLILLNTIKPVVAKNDRIPVLQDILMSKGQMSAYNGSCGMIIDHDMGLMHDMQIPFEKFYVFVKGAKEDIALDLVVNVLTLKSGRSTSKLPIQSGEDFPEFNFGEEEVIPVKNDIFQESLKFCSPFASRKSARYELHGVYYNDKGSWATEGQRISNYNYTFVEAEDPPVVIPLELAKILSDFEFDIDEIFYDKQKLIAYSDTGITIFGNVIDASEYPKLHEYIPKIKTFINFPKDELKKGLITVGDFSGDIVEEAECILNLGETVSIAFAGSTAQIKEVFNFGQEYPEGSWILNPYHFSVMLDKCDEFAFHSKGKMNILYGQSENKKFKCVLALQQEK